MNRVYSFRIILSTIEFEFKSTRGYSDTVFSELVGAFDFYRTPDRAYGAAIAIIDIH